MNILQQKLIVTATGGAEIDNCIIDCIALALKSRVEVVLSHNSKEYSILPTAIFREVYSTERAAQND